jgi:hypothetical protein
VLGEETTYPTIIAEAMTMISAYHLAPTEQRGMRTETPCPDVNVRRREPEPACLKYRPNRSSPRREGRTGRVTHYSDFGLEFLRRPYCWPKVPFREMRGITRP